MKVNLNIESHIIAFGPVPSRRLGRSLGINNIPVKHCTYSCIYCQVGPTSCQEIVPREYFTPESVAHAVSQKVRKVQDHGEEINYLTFVPDGEPTLDINLGKAIDLLRPLGLKIAVISNASLLWRSEVREMLNKADWVSLKVDTLDEMLWRRINQPHSQLQFSSVLTGIEQFASNYNGILTTETMLVADVNDSQESITAVSDFLSGIKPHIAYIAVPIRPPAENNVSIPREESIVQAYDIFSAKLKNVELLTAFEGDVFVSTVDPIQDLLAIVAVHPMRKDALQQFLAKAGLNWDVIQNLIAQELIKEIHFSGKDFYIRHFKKT